MVFHKIALGNIVGLLWVLRQEYELQVIDLHDHDQNKASAKGSVCK